MSFQAPLTYFSSSRILDGGGVRRRTIVFVSDQRFSIGFKSGLWAGHGSITISAFSRAALATFERCGVALSSWKIPLPRGKCFCKVGTTYFRIVSACVSPVTEPFKGTIGSSPFQEKHSQNILLGLYFTVTAIQSGFNSSSGSHHTFSFLSCWNCVKVLSFEKSTLFYCLVVHFSRT